MFMSREPFHSLPRAQSGTTLIIFFSRKKKKKNYEKSTGGSPIEQKTVGPAVTECKVAVRVNYSNFLTLSLTHLQTTKGKEDPGSFLCNGRKH